MLVTCCGFGTQADSHHWRPLWLLPARQYDWTAMIKDMIAKHQAGTLGGSVYTLTLKNDGFEDRLQPWLQPAR